MKVSQKEHAVILYRLKKKDEWLSGIVTGETGRWGINKREAWAASLEMEQFRLT